MKINLLPLLLLFIGSCKGQDKASQSLPGSKTGPAVNSNWKDPLTAPWTDPYFIESRDTVSVYGPSHITRNILQDRNGNMWFASWQGIMRYDGKSFTNFTLQAGLRHFHVFSLLEDTSGNLWFGTIGAGVYRYDGRSFTNFTAQEGLADNSVGCIMEDRSGNIWFGTDSGVSRYDGKSFTSFTPENGQAPHSVNSMIQDRNGKIWIGSFEGVTCYDGRTFTGFLNREGVAFVNVRSIIEDKTGNIWIGGADGLWRHDGKSFTGIVPNFTGYIFEDKTGKIWISAGEPRSHNMSAFRLDGMLPTRILEKNGRNDHQVFGITEDNAGNIWFGTMQGAVRYDGKSFADFREKPSGE